MKILASIVCFLLLASPINNEPTKKNITIEFISDCEMTIEGLTGMFKVRSANHNQIGFRATQYYFWDIEEYYRGGVVFNFRSPIERDFMLYTRSTYTGLWNPPTLGPALPWSFIISTTRRDRYLSNEGALITIKGPCESIRVTNGTIRVTAGSTSYDVIVDENDYINFPIWELSIY